MTDTPEGAASLAADVQRSLRRARLDAERRRLEGERRGVLARLGARASELVAAGALPAADLAGELARVDGACQRSDEHGREIEALGGPPPEAGAVSDPTPGQRAERVGVRP